MSDRTARRAAGSPAAAYEALWSEINLCEKCKFDRRVDPQIRERWQKEPFLPYPGIGPEPAALPVRYLLVGMEPSARPKAKKTREYMERKIAEGSRNFKGDVHIRWATHNWLVKKGEEALVMTDLDKCMLPTKDADKTAPRRYANCWPWLGREIALFPTLRAIIPMGDEPYRWLLAFAQDSWPTITKPIVHPGHRFTKKFKEHEVNFAGLPTNDQYAEFAGTCDPKAETRLDARKRGLLGRWNVQFAEIRAELKRLGV